ncbi:IS66 family insertion sequence element accessory protein TnpA [Longitalea arenae]|uniref:IS66 family insertion sequence element accessory protein TnpA n=1 Tax=Longitalea arenae TaxID=2812558 RepID=UPI001967878D|nr:hypothetical protein [Longitalea arenae]
MLEAEVSNPKRTAQEMFSLIQEQQAGELPVKTFCEQKKISETCFYYWRKKYVNDASSVVGQPTENFSLLELNDDAHNSAQLFAEYNGLKLYKEVPVSYLKELMR